MKYKITYTYDVNVMVEAPNKAVALDIAADVAVVPSFNNAPGVICATAEFTDMTDIECMDDEDPPQKEFS